MRDPYHWDFPSRNDTMYMSTISNKDLLNNSSFYNPSFHRQSSFQQTDIPGAQNARQIKQIINNQRRPNFALSTSIQPRPQFFRNMSNKSTNPLRTDDIDGAFPCANQFKTPRIVNPLVPRYKLPSFTKVSIDEGRNFIRNTLDVSDINSKGSYKKGFISPQKQHIEGSSPKKLFQTIDSTQTQKMNVEDINKYRRYYSKRRYVDEPKNPLNPEYTWRDNKDGKINSKLSYMDEIKPKKQVSEYQKRKSLNLNDIVGAHHGSYNQRRLFIDKRKQFRDYMNISDIGKTYASSLKKGIERRIPINPLIPNYSTLSRFQ